MTSTVGGGSLISRQKEQSCVNYVCDRGEGVKKSEHFVDVIYGSPVNLKTVPNYCSRPRNILVGACPY